MPELWVVDAATDLTGSARNVLPLGRRQFLALLRATVRELCWGLPAVWLEVRKWRWRTKAIPDLLLRKDALDALKARRGHIDGAALFWTLPRRRNLALLRVLVAFEVIYDYLDNVSERLAGEDERSGRQLFLALTDALAADRCHADYYRDLPGHDDGGYLRALVDQCRAECRKLPSLGVVRSFIALEGSHMPILAVNHVPDAGRRDAALKAWAADEPADEHDLRWYERTAAASQSIVTFALLALASEPHMTDEDAQATYDGYVPWCAYTVTMLDSYVDQVEDAHSGAHSYFSHYPTPEDAVLRLCKGIERSADCLLALPNGERHAVVLACMVAMYLSKDSARAADLRGTSARILQAGGSLTTLLLPVLRIWRICYRQTAAT